MSRRYREKQHARAAPPPVRIDMGPVFTPTFVAVMICIVVATIVAILYA